MTFDDFMRHVDQVIFTKCGMSVQDLADAPWRDLYDSTSGEATDEDIYECLADYDDLFANFLENLDE